MLNDQLFYNSSYILSAIGYANGRINGKYIPNLKLLYI